jgi:predicted cupin superfamily sugar epimerase
VSSVTDAPRIIAQLGLAPHPEGGWYAQTWRADAVQGTRPSASAIHFLLEQDQVSHWHKVDAAEIWLWHAGAPVTLGIAESEAGPVNETVLGGDVLAGQLPQVLVPAHFWQSAAPRGGWALVSCIVSPAFEFFGFALAPPGWSPG